MESLDKARGWKSMGNSMCVEEGVGGDGEWVENGWEKRWVGGWGRKGIRVEVGMVLG